MELLWSISCSSDLASPAGPLFEAGTCRWETDDVLAAEMQLHMSLLRLCALQLPQMGDLSEASHTLRCCLFTDVSLHAIGQEAVLDTAAYCKPLLDHLLKPVSAAAHSLFCSILQTVHQVRQPSLACQL